MTYTSGPWVLVHPYVYGHDEIYPIAELRGIEPTVFEQDANARLIAAAPDLLEVAEVAQGSLCGFICWHSLGSETKHSDLCLRLDVVIAKAKGAA